MAIQTPDELHNEKLLAHYKDSLDRSLELYRTTQAIHLASFKATLDFGSNATRGALLLNGAAAIALLAFLGSPRPDAVQITAVALSLATFAMGALAAVVAMGWTYLGQAFFTLATRRGADHSPTGYVFQGLAILTILVSGAMFLCGLWRVASVFSGNLSLVSLLGF